MATHIVSGIYSGNVTNSSEEVRLEGSLEESDLISIKKPNGTVDQVPSSRAADELADLESKVGLHPNSKLNFTPEDDGEPHPPLPHIIWLEEHSHSTCGLEFQQSMEAIGAEHWCSFQKVIGPYSSLTHCMEQLSMLMGCFYPNPSVQDFFLRMHAQFFLSCPEEELLLSDAPHGVVMVLTLVPVTLIPLLVYLVVWKSNGRE
ncbi:hypothetical protein CRUP_029991 [Coryphaenoides rupestris]|nr:hypothetical protein CRUP_029991 [Coryphaenoides rupestris]